MQSNMSGRQNSQNYSSGAGPVSSNGISHHGSQHNSHENEVLRNLMINYIPTQVEESYLRQMFEAYGPVESVKIVYDKENNMSKGYGFVKYRSIQSASLAISNLNGYPILNKRLKVAYAKADEAQRLLQQMQLENGVSQVGTMDPNQMQWMYYMQLQAQQQQMWMQQMQQMMLNQGNQPANVAQPGQGATVAGTPNGLSPQQQMMMLVQGQQQNQSSGQVNTQ